MIAFKGSVGSKRLSLLAKVLDDYCCRAGIAVGHPARERLGRRIVELFQSGIHNPDELLAALNSGYEKWLGEVGLPSSSSEHASLASHAAPPESGSPMPVEARGRSRFAQGDTVDRPATPLPRSTGQNNARKEVPGSTNGKSSKTSRPSPKTSEPHLRDGEAGIIENNEM